MARRFGGAQAADVLGGIIYGRTCVAAGATSPIGMGAFLLAASEMVRHKMFQWRLFKEEGCH